MRICAIMLLSCVSLSTATQDAVAVEGPLTDEALLEDLGAELLKPSTPKPKTVLDQSLLEQLGEEVGQRSPAKQDWLSQVIQHMQAAQSILVQAETVVDASAAQQQALVGLDAMIAELAERKQQCSGGQCNKPGDPNPDKKPSSSGKAGKSPAKAASPSTSSGADLSTELAVAGELVRDLWGKLPDRQREQILQPLSEEFLPKYASEIEAYFRALAQPKTATTEAP